MPLRPSRTTVIMGIVLVGAWAGLALGLGALLSRPASDDRPAGMASEARRSSNMSIDVTGIDPCSHEPVRVAARMTIDVTRRGEAGSTSVDADVHLEALPGTALIEPRPGAVLTAAIEPLVRRFAPYSTPTAGIPNVHPLRTPLADPYSSLDLAVDLLGVVNESEEVTLSMFGPRIEIQRSPCSTTPPGPPSPPITQGVPLPPPG